MLKRREVVIGLLSACTALGVSSGLRSQEPVLRSSIFDWTTLEVSQTSVGERRDVVRRPTATLAELEMHVTTLNPGEAAHAPHQHPAEELLIVKEGLVEALVGGQMRRVGPGSVIFQASNEMHTVRNVGDTRATYHVIQWVSADTPRP